MPPRGSSGAAAIDAAAASLIRPALNSTWGCVNGGALPPHSYPRKPPTQPSPFGFSLVSLSTSVFSFRAPLSVLDSMRRVLLFRVPLCSGHQPGSDSAGPSFCVCPERCLATSAGWRTGVVVAPFPFAA